MAVNFDKVKERFRETFRKVDDLSRLVLYGYQPNKEKQLALWWHVEKTKELLNALEPFYELDASLKPKLSDEELQRVYGPMKHLLDELPKLYQQSLDIDPELEKWHAALKELQRVYGEFIGIRDMR